MHKRTLAAMTAVGLTAAIAVPTVAFGNARRKLGSFSFIRSAHTPYRPAVGRKRSTAGRPSTAPAQPHSHSTSSCDPDSGVLGSDATANITSHQRLAHIHVAGRGQRAAGRVRIHSALSASARTDVGDGLLGDRPGAGHGDHRRRPPTSTSTCTPATFPHGAIRGQLSRGPPPAGEAHMLPVPLRAYDSRRQRRAEDAALETRTISLATAKTARATASSPSRPAQPQPSSPDRHRDCRRRAASSSCTTRHSPPSRRRAASTGPAPIRTSPSRRRWQSMQPVR